MNIQRNDSTIEMTSMNRTKLQSFLSRWDEHVERLINISAKKVKAVETKHRQIVEGACKVFFKKGFHPTTMREIAKAVGMSMGQMYHYIASKDDVLFLIHKHMQTSWYEQLTNAKIEECQDPVIRIELALNASLNYLIENRELIQFIFTESKYLSKKHLKVVLEMDNKNVSGYWSDLLEPAFKQQGIRFDVRLAGNLVSYNNVFLCFRERIFSNKSQQELVTSIIDFIFGGLGLTRPSQAKTV